MSTSDRSCYLAAHKDTGAKMWSKKQYLDLVSLFLQAKPPKPHELRPCYQHELLLHAICRPKEPLTKDELTDLVWNMTNGPKKKSSRPRRRQSGGMDIQREPTDAEVVFGGCVKTPPSPIYRCGWERSRIEWLSKLEQQQRRQYYQAWQEPPGSINVVKDAKSKSSKVELRQKRGTVARPERSHPAAGPCCPWPAAGASPTIPAAAAWTCPTARRVRDMGGDQLFAFRPAFSTI